MQASSPIQKAVRDLLLLVLEATANLGVRVAQRRQYAALVWALSEHVPPAEDVCADVVQAALASVDDHRIVDALLHAAEALAPSSVGLVSPVSRLCVSARSAGHAATLLFGIAHLLSLPGVEGLLPSEWLAWASEQRACEVELFAAIRRGSPSVSGWVALARWATDESKVISGSELVSEDNPVGALDALSGALEAEREGVSRVVLARWLVDAQAEVYASSRARARSAPPERSRSTASPAATRVSLHVER